MACIEQAFEHARYSFRQSFLSSTSKSWLKKLYRHHGKLHAPTIVKHSLRLRRFLGTRVMCRNQIACVPRCGGPFARPIPNFPNPATTAKAICYALTLAAQVGTGAIELTFGSPLPGASQRVPSIQHVPFFKCVPMGSRRKSCSI